MRAAPAPKKHAMAGQDSAGALAAKQQLQQQDNESSADCTLDWGKHAGYVINEGLETEEVIVAARATEGNIQWWFYDVWQIVHKRLD